ncbi:MAG: class I SAM-dependent methyltransferase [Lysobacteraceae bacterium]
MTSEALDFTGERFTPECVREMRYEHWHRYAFARAVASGKRVLDAACGEGYGSAMLATAASSVTGVDIADEAVAHARQRYRHANLTFQQGDCTDPTGLPDGPFDLIVSFETLEHVHEQSRMLSAFAARLSDDGILLVSSPDKLNYSDRRNYRNEFHVRELYRDEFESLLGEHFPATRLYAQKLAFQSLLWSVDGRSDRYAASVLGEDGESLATTLDYPPMYYVAACARNRAALDALPALSLFSDLEESVYRHYEHEIRKNMSAGARIQELEQALADAERRLAALASEQGE